MALWIERLQAGRRLSPERCRARIALGLTSGLLTPLVLASISRGLISGWHGPTNTIAAFVAPLALCILSLIELGILPTRLMHNRAAPAVTGVILLLPYA
ncbi:MAG: hypothetical protein FJW31_14290 [Acidobacteria bacterium]|nr:hypothetical protein [Acidobacteriota bacterium]